ncbi:MAG: ABC transporter substrate-binding protein [Mariprofundaceae bacterium]|nr:ABC transporter substrate-binding protein [Mariprofundaceae bacterium]
MNKQIMLSVALAGLMLLPVAWAEQETPKQVVASTIQSIIDVLEARADLNVMTDGVREQIRQAVSGRFDYREMARRSIGKPWKKMDEVEQASFTDIFRQVLEYSYGNQLSTYHGQKVEFKEADFKRGKARVKGAVVDASKSIPMEYRLHQTATGWQVYDIKIEGVSMVATFRKDFKSIIRKDGVEGLLSKLQAKVKKLKAKG